MQCEKLELKQQHMMLYFQFHPTLSVCPAYPALYIYVIGKSLIHYNKKDETSKVNEYTFSILQHKTNKEKNLDDFSSLTFCKSM